MLRTESLNWAYRRTDNPQSSYVRTMNGIKAYKIKSSPYTHSWWICSDTLRRLNEKLLSYTSSGIFCQNVWLLQCIVHRAQPDFAPSRNTSLGVIHRRTCRVIVNWTGDFIKLPFEHEILFTNCWQKRLNKSNSNRFRYFILKDLYNRICSLYEHWELGTVK